MYLLVRLIRKTAAPHHFLVERGWKNSVRFSGITRMQREDLLARGSM
jgi:hypothetical protein